MTPPAPAKYRPPALFERLAEKYAPQNQGKQGAQRVECPGQRTVQVRTRFGKQKSGNYEPDDGRCQQGYPPMPNHQPDIGLPTLLRQKRREEQQGKNQSPCPYLLRWKAPNSA